MSRIAALLICALPLCGFTSCTKEVVTEPEVVNATQLIYVPIDDKLVRQHEVADGPLAMCPDVAAKRAKELRDCNADKAAIARVRGTKVPALAQPPQ